MIYVVDGRLISHEVRIIYKAETVFETSPSVNFYTSKQSKESYSLLIHLDFTTSPATILICTVYKLF